MKKSNEMSSTVEKRFFTVAEVALVTGLTEASIRARLQRGEIKHIKIGRRVLICKKVLNLLIGGNDDE
ncbi:MAG: helix-turn-helix domain-containing protein [Candidatus Marinimicrobia bacterium]|nr:helix-turn-helix domain-containing protein [Candidatus Neomarinimicrobiota bacterium]MBT4944945.1 helix-turn-helix domain-containing protein [Candidatus Neomarinimicrobiota bacterium]MBT5268492.1 helix-turn-helix domain-containing protein [Candidatus Neomarinimicrobiota bacterium]MBT7578427.1 helix-turn-helix domain-containing protein [Candidatus Neomarinimicrobiota bacterium]MBT7616172.1 helix-turn-helix domain-containing protein [Calditrichota bacterium]